MKSAVQEKLFIVRGEYYGHVFHVVGTIIHLNASRMKMLEQLFGVIKTVKDRDIFVIG